MGDYTSYYNKENEDGLPFYIGPSVELYGVQCMNPHKHPRAIANHYPLLKVLGRGCDYGHHSFGTDPLSVNADI
jgi:hypothetical protein